MPSSRPPVLHRNNATLRWPPTSCHANVIKHLPITLYNVCIVIDKRRCQILRKLSLERCLFVLKLGACFCTPEPSAYRLHSIHNRRIAVPTVLDFFVVWTERKCVLLSGTRRALGSSLGHRRTVRFGLGSGLAVWWNYPWQHRTRNIEAKRETDTWTGTSYMSTYTNKCLDTLPSMFVRACVHAKMTRCEESWKNVSEIHVVSGNNAKRRDTRCLSSLHQRLILKPAKYIL